MTRILNQVKSSLRLSHSKFDDSQLIPMIKHCRHDLMIQGVPKAVVYKDHPLVTRAIIHYCHINFPIAGDATDIKNIERHERAYESLLHSLALTDWSKEVERDV